MKRFSHALLDAPRGISGPNGVAVSQHHKASQTGADIMSSGGTAMDAAVAIAFALGVVEPWMSGLGGVGYILIGRYDETPEVIDFSTRSPQGIKLEQFNVVGENKDAMHPWDCVEDDRNTKGVLSICAPTMAPGLELGWSRHGRMPWAELVKPAQKLASDGQPIDWYTQLIIASVASHLKCDHDAANLFLATDGTGRGAEWVSRSLPKIRQQKLADTLEVIASEGAKSLLNGSLAHAIVSDIHQKGGVLKIKDFEAVQPVVQNPLHLKLKNGGHFWTIPGLSGGPTIANFLASWQDQASPDFDNPTPRALTAMSNLVDRYSKLGDGHEYSATPSCTTSFCVIDGSGLVVAATISLVSLFGSKVVSPSTGILLNNAISWFDPVAGKPNSLQARKQPLTNMAPSIFKTNDGNHTAISAAGGRRIIPAIAQVAAYSLLDCIDIESALSKPRLDIRGDGTITADLRFPETSLKELRTMAPVDMVLPTVFPNYFAIVNAAQYGCNGDITGYCEPFCPNAATAVVPPDRTSTPSDRSMK